MQDLRLDNSAKWEILKNLGGFPRLKRLHLRGTTNFGSMPKEAIVCLLQMAPNIETLELDMIHSLDDAVFNILGSMKRLMNLQLKACHGTDIPALQRFASTTVSLQSVDFIQHPITRPDYRRIQQPTEKVMEALSQIRELWKLRLNQCDPGTISDKFVDSLKKHLIIHSAYGLRR